MHDRTGCRYHMILHGAQEIPRSCPRCGLGPCKNEITDPSKPQGPPPNVGSAVKPPTFVVAQPSSVVAPAAPMGCICPPGANLQCKNPTCPRRNSLLPRGGRHG
jgi:hypothetical protein